jgi:hypothetical protein
MRLDIERPTPSTLVVRYRPIHIWIVAGMLAATAVLIVVIVVGTAPVSALLEDPTGLVGAIYVPVLCMGGSSAGATALIGLLALVFLGRTEICALDKAAGSVTVERRGLLGTNVVTRRVDEILAVEVKTRLGSQAMRWHRIYLVLASGERLPAAAWMPVSQARASAQQIREFLGLGGISMSW